MHKHHVQMSFPPFRREFHRHYYYCGLYLFLEKGYSTAMQKTIEKARVRGI